MCAPRAPDPRQTAAAQTASNVDTAKAQAQLNNVNQVTPYGNLTYTSTLGAGGIPQYTATQTLSPEGQKLFDSSNEMKQNLANLGAEQSGRLSGLLNEPFSLDNDAVEGRLMELGRKRLDPALNDRRDALQTELVNRGIRPGSTAYDRAMNNANQGENDAYNQLALTGRSQAVSEALMQRQQPLNEILALAGQGQLQQPSYVNTPQTGVAGTDVGGITNAAFQGNMAGHRQNMANLGGLFGAGANALMMFSDRRLKTDVKKVGKTDDGQKIYSYRYKDGGPTLIGLMAQDVEKKHPEAVATHESGFKMVDYSKAVA